MIPALRDGIKTLMYTVDGISTENGFYLEIPDNASYPYVAFYGIEENFDLDSVNRHEPNTVQFTFRGDDEDTMNDLVETFKDTFDQGQNSISVTGYTCIDIRRLLSVPVQRFGDIYQRTLDYEFYIYETR
jgi:hypothetical protein